MDYVERCLQQPLETSPVHESVVLRRAYFNNECINSFMLGCAVKSYNYGCIYILVVLVYNPNQI